MSGSTVTVAVNLCWLVPGVVGGSEEYATRLLRALPPATPEGAARLAVTVFAAPQVFRAHPDLAVHLTPREAPVDTRVRAVRVGLEASWLAAAVRRGRFDVVHHVGGTVPPGVPGPAVVTVHDLQPIERPDAFGALKRRYLHWALPRAVRRAELVLTPSGFVRQRVIELLGADPARVRVQPAPVTAWVAPAEAAVESVVARHGITRPYVLYPAITYEHKNHAVLLRALADLPEVALVLTGRAGPAEHEVMTLAAAAGVTGRVHRLDRLPRAELDALIAGADALVFPSRYEGFGLPVVEAMAAGRPVVASATTAITEVVADAGVLVGPDDVAGWRDAIERVVGDPGLAEELARAGRDRSTRWSPERCGAALAAAYRDLAAGDMPTPETETGDPPCASW